MRKTWPFAVMLAAAVFLTPTLARAAHNTVTVGAITAVFMGRSSWQVNSSVSVRNTTANPQTGQLTLIVFQVNFDGRVIEVARRDLGTVDLPASGSAPSVPISVELHSSGTYILLADYASRVVGGNPVPHTHSGTLSVSF